MFYLLGAVALVYALLAGLKTIAEFDLGWQMAIARWTVQHHQIPSVDVLSYTAAGQPWIYPVGSGLLFYGAFLLGGYSLLSWLAAAGCAGVVALLLRRGTAVSAALAILAVPLITSRTTPRAEMFTVVLFAATLSLLWQQHEGGDARLWLLPVLMVAWVNLHPGFIAGLGLLGAYVMVEVLDMLQPDLRIGARTRLRRAWPWLLATFAATLINPWGWNVFQVIARQEAAMGAHSQLILEWAPIPMNWTHIWNGLSLRDPDEFYVLLLVVDSCGGYRPDAPANWRRDPDVWRGLFPHPAYAVYSFIQHRCRHCRRGCARDCRGQPSKKKLVARDCVRLSLSPPFCRWLHWPP